MIDRTTNSEKVLPPRAGHSLNRQRSRHAAYMLLNAEFYKLFLCHRYLRLSPFLIELKKLRNFARFFTIFSGEIIEKNFLASPYLNTLAFHRPRLDGFR